MIYIVIISFIPYFEKIILGEFNPFVQLAVTFHTHAKVVGIMRQNACTLAFCVQNLL